MLKAIHSGVSASLRLTNGASVCAERTAFAAHISAITLWLAIVEPSACCSSVDCAASRALVLVAAISVSSTDLSLQRSARNHLPWMGLSDERHGGGAFEACVTFHEITL